MESVAFRMHNKPPDDKPSRDKTQKSPDLEPWLERFCKNEKKKFIEHHGVYAEKHPLTDYVRSLGPAKANQDIKIYVTKRWDEANAVAFPDGTIFLSDRLFKFCEYKEELEFVLQHEISHIQGLHAKERLNESEGRGALGRGRINEYEADLEEILKDKNSTLNPHGAVVFLRRLAETQEQKAKEDEEHRPSIVHGGTYARLINVEFAVRLVDMDALNADLQCIPTLLRETVEGQEDVWKRFVDIRPERFDEIKEAASGLGFFGALSNIAKAYSNELPENQREELISIFKQKINDVVRRAYPEASSDAVEALGRLLIFDSLLSSRWSDTTKNAETTYYQLLFQLRDSTAIFVEFPDILDSIQERLYAGISHDTMRDVFFKIVRGLEDKEPQEAFVKAERVLTGLKKACSGRKASFMIDDMALADLLLKTYPRDKDQVERYLNEVERKGLDIKKNELFEMVAAHFGLTAKEQKVMEEHALFKEQTAEGRAGHVITLEMYEKAKAVKSFKRTWAVEDAQRRTLKTMERMKRRADEILDIIKPQRFEDVLAFLDVYYRGITGKIARPYDDYVFYKGPKEPDAFSEILMYEPHAFHSALLKKLKRHDLTNEQVIALIEKLSLIEFRSYALMLVGGARTFSREELKRLKELVDRDILQLILRKMRRLKTREELFDFLSFVHREGMVSDISLLPSRHGTEMLHYVTPCFLDDIGLEVLRSHRFDMCSKKEVDELLTTSCFISDPNLKLRLQKAVLNKYVPMLDAKEAYELLFNDKRVADYSAIEAREEYLDKMVTNPSELKRIKDEIVSRARGLESEVAGAMVLKEAIVDVILKDKERLFKAVLLTRRSNRELSTYLTEVLFAEYIIEKGKGEDFAGFLENYYMSSRASTADVLHGIPIDKFENMLYKLDYESRHILCRELLIGQGGVLLDRKKRERLLGWFFKSFVEEPKNDSEKKVYDFLELAFRTVAANADVATLYFILHPIVVERMLGKPKKRTPLKSVMKDAKKAVLKVVCESPEDEFYFAEDLEEISYAVEKIITEGYNPRYEYGPEADDDAELGKNAVASRSLEIDKLCMEYLTEVPESVEMLAPIDFVKQLSSKLGAPGVRFLQSLGIYADIPPALREEFDEVYDNVKGQFKLSAFHTLEKNWNGETPLEQELKRLGKRVGGGSLVTVYESRVKDKRCVVKVVNPNVSYRAETVCDNLRKIFTADRKLGRALPLIENIRSWIKTDVSFDPANYEELFRKQNDGFKVPGNEYTLRIPHVMKKGSKYMAEEFINGNNLTQWSKVSKKHDMKKIVSLVVKNTVHQVTNGVVHADIHVGNVRITKDKRIALLDKNFVLVLSEHDKGFIGSLSYLVKDKPALAKAVGEYLCGFEENKDVDKDALVGRLEEVLVANSHKDVGSFVSDVVAVVTEQKGVIPLNVMLLVKNALALERMAKRAGFANVIDAFLS